jgi:hypothetical protein
MARKKTANPDNLYTFRICGEDVACIASLGASIAYRDEFIGKLDRPYTGMLETDLPIVYRRTLPVVHVELDGDGNVVMGDDGTPREVPADYEGAKKQVPNPDYYGQDMVAVLRFIWAMARAEGSVTDGWDEWSRRVMASPMGMHEQQRIFNKALYEVALKHWFLDEEGRLGAEEQDSQQEA